MDHLELACTWFKTLYDKKTITSNDFNERCNCGYEENYSGEKVFYIQATGIGIVSCEYYRGEWDLMFTPNGYDDGLDNELKLFIYRTVMVKLDEMIVKKDQEIKHYKQQVSDAGVQMHLEVE